MDTFFEFLPFLQNIAPAWKVVTILIGIAPTIAAIVTGFVSLWHGAVATTTGIAALPGCAKVMKIANWLKIQGDRIDAGQSKVLAVINRLSALPLPQHAAAAVHPSA